MLLYNVTYNVEEAVAADWLAWIKAHYLPAVRETGLFRDDAVYRLHGAYAGQGITYSVQLFADTFEQVRVFGQLHADVLHHQHATRYGDRVVHFQTLLERQ